MKIVDTSSGAAWSPDCPAHVVDAGAYPSIGDWGRRRGHLEGCDEGAHGRCRVALLGTSRSAFLDSGYTPVYPNVPPTLSYASDSTDAPGMVGGSKRAPESGPAGSIIVRACAALGVHVSRCRVYHGVLGSD
eukprot:6190400-Pleurochrysis_carterae.AAC.1